MENAELYSSANGMQKKDAKEILTEFQDKIKLKSGDRILDVGCGSGEVTTKIILPHLPNDFKELIGLDVSNDMITYAKNSYSHPRVTFVQCDITHSSKNILKDITKKVVKSNEDKRKLKEGNHDCENFKSLMSSQKILDYSGDTVDKCKNIGYDVIFSFYCLHWIPNQRLAFKNIFKLLVSGGEALLVFLVQSPIFTLYRELSKMILWKDYMRDVEKFIPFYQDSKCPEEDFKEIIKTTGFAILTSDCREKNYVFESFSSLRDAISAVNPFLPRMPTGLQEDFINECLYQTQRLKLATFKNNHYQVSYKLMVAHIKKPEL